MRRNELAYDAAAVNDENDAMMEMMVSVAAAAVVAVALLELHWVQSV